jgi:hypothetical protein
VGSPCLCEVGAKADDIGNSLWVSATFQAAGGFAKMEAGDVFADEGMAYDESD